MKSLPLTAKRCPATIATCAKSCSLQAYTAIGTMVQMTLAQSLVAPQRVALRTQHRSMAATPLVVRATRQTRVARCAAFAAADTSKVLEDVRGIIAEQLGTDLEKVSPDSKFVDLGADSLDTVEIMMALEEKFDLQLDEEGAEKISTVQEAADLISQQIDSK